MIGSFGTVLLAFWTVPGDLAASMPPPPCDAAVEAAVRAVADGDIHRADSLFVTALERCPDHPGVLGEFAGLRFRQNRFDEAADLALRLLELDPASGWGWDLVASSRYLSDDPRGALRAWNRVGRPVVREVRVRGADPDGSPAVALDPETVEGPPSLIRAVNVPPGQLLTPSTLTRGERSLQAIPAVARARLDYRPLSGGEAALDGAVLLHPPHPFTRGALPAHGLRALGGTVHLAWAHSIDRFERWEIAGVTEGRLREGRMTLSHPGPPGPGVWRWEVTHSAGHFRSAIGTDTLGEEAPEFVPAPVANDRPSVRLERTGIATQYERWVTARIRGSLTTGLDRWTEVGSFARWGTSVEFLTEDRALALDVQLDGSVPLDDAGSAFARAGFRTELLTPLGRSVELASRGGVDAVSNGVPPDLRPRFGAGRTATHLMRARSAFDGEGVVRPPPAGSAWAHGGLELRKWGRSPARSMLGGALFLDAVRTLNGLEVSLEQGAIGGSTPAGTSVHLGVGLRARVPGSSGWLRLDWAIDPSDGASRLSAAWVEAR